MGQAPPGLWRGTPSSQGSGLSHCVWAVPPQTSWPPHPLPSRGALSAWPLSSHHVLFGPHHVPMHRLFPGAGGRTAVALRSALVPGVGPITWLGPDESLPDG